MVWFLVYPVYGSSDPEQFEASRSCKGIWWPTMLPSAAVRSRQNGAGPCLCCATVAGIGTGIGLVRSRWKCPERRFHENFRDDLASILVDYVGDSSLSDG